MRLSRLRHISTFSEAYTCAPRDGAVRRRPSTRPMNPEREASMLIRSLLSAAIVAASVSYASAADISGAGATFPYPIYAKWADAYKKETGIGLNYQSIGSGGGIKQIKAKTVTFGASDMPLKPKDLTRAGLVQFPTVDGRRSCRSSISTASSRATWCSTARRSPTSISARSPTGTIRRSSQAQPERQAAGAGDRRRAPLGRLGHHLHLHQLSVARSARTGSPRSAPTPPSSGRPASAPRATKASPTTSRRPRASIGYVEYAYAKQNKMTTIEHGQQGRQDRQPRRRSVPGRRRQRRLGVRRQAST